MSEDSSLSSGETVKLWRSMKRYSQYLLLEFQNMPGLIHSSLLLVHRICGYLYAKLDCLSVCQCPTDDTLSPSCRL